MEMDLGWERDEGGGNLLEEDRDLGRPLAGNGGLLSDMFRGFSISGKRRSASGPGRGKLAGGLSVVGDGRVSVQRRKNVSMIKNEKNVINMRK